MDIPMSRPLISRRVGVSLRTRRTARIDGEGEVVTLPMGGLVVVVLAVGGMATGVGTAVTSPAPPTSPALAAALADQHQVGNEIASLSASAQHLRTTLEGTPRRSVDATTGPNAVAPPHVPDDRERPRLGCDGRSGRRHPIRGPGPDPVTDPPARPTAVGGTTTAPVVPVAAATTTSTTAPAPVPPSSTSTTSTTSTTRPGRGDDGGGGHGEDGGGDDD